MPQTQSFLTTVSDRENHIDSTQIKFISPIKWQKYLIECLKNMGLHNQKKKNLITDLITIVSSVPKQNFVEATLQIRPFKPQFFEVLPIFVIGNHSTMDETVVKNIKYRTIMKQNRKNEKEKFKKHKMTQQTLTKQFEKGYHPFRFIIKNVKRLLELKFKSLIDLQKIENFQQLFSQLKSDMAVFNQFMHKAAQPYKKLFKESSSTRLSDVSQQITKFEEFMDTFLSDNEKINKCLHNIMLYGCRAFYQDKINKKMKDFPTIEEYQMPGEFRIDGCYIRAMNSLMQLSQEFKEQEIMRKLLQYRLNILVDISEFYKQRKIQTKQLQVNAEIQIQIIRFTLAKLKGWICEIFGRLKYLEFLLGEQIHYKFQEASYVFSQLSMAFQILDLDTKAQK